MGYYELTAKTTLLLCLVLGAAAVAGCSTPPSNNILRQVPAVYVFSDSTLDVGNNYLPGKNVPRADRPYYGIDMPGSSKPNRRFISIYSATITELYRMGPRMFAIINVGLAGCLPIARVLSATGACSDSRNKLAAGFNDALRSLLAGLPGRLPGLAYPLADSYGIMATVFADPLESGFTDVSSACSTGRLGVGGCQVTSTVCANHDQHYF
ncbi:GDSL esterase/lipase At5g37690-like [Miscanthus floridulus]|uniref:GDSL esterase/lipase At5g37690-like n=1 Tax=Miscanthus floridulus TaxID=154761 RepID=UPI0034589188